VTLIIQETGFLLLVNPDPVMDALDLLVVDFAQKDVLEPAAAQNSPMSRVQFKPNTIQQTSPSLGIQVVDDSFGLDKFVGSLHDVCVDDGGEESFNFPFVISVGFLVFPDIGSEVEVVE